MVILRQRTSNYQYFKMAKKKKTEVGTPEDNKLIQHYGEYFKQTIKSLGGVDEVQMRLELSTSIFYYHSKAKKAGIDDWNTEQLIDFILKLFRKAIATKGYEGLRHNMIPIVYYFGTIKDKAALCLQYFDYDRWEPDGKNPPVSRRTIDTIRMRIHKTGKDNVQEFLGYLATYDAYTSVTKHFLHTASVYFSKAFQTALYIQNYEGVKNVADLFTTLRPLIGATSTEKDIDVKAFEKQIDEQNEYLKSNWRFGKLKILNDKVVDDEASNCLEYASFLAEQTAKYLSKVKGMIEGLREWTKEQEGNSFNSILMPLELRNKVIAPEYYIAIDEIPDQYYKAHLKKMEEKGETITDYDKSIAIFPSYEDVTADESMKQQTIGKLNDTLQQRKSL